MTRILLGDKKVGVQGIYYFDDYNEAHEFGEEMAPFLKNLRSNSPGAKLAVAITMDKYRDNTMLYNFLKKCKERVEAENQTPEVWWEPGGELYGEKWHNEELPNGQGETYIGNKLVTEIDSVGRKNFWIPESYFWKENPNPITYKGEGYYICSNCKEKIWIEYELDIMKDRYCRHCGTLMRAAKENDNPNQRQEMKTK